MSTKLDTKATQALESVTSAGRVPDTTVRDATQLTVGQAVRQGDVYLARIPDAAPCGAQLKGQSQIVAGESLGSRHIMAGDFKLYVRGSYTPKGVEVDAAWGPVIAVGKKGATLTHPEHADVQLGAGHLYQTWQQVDPETRLRVQD
jgi:hypothetical protein